MRHKHLIAQFLDYMQVVDAMSHTTVSKAIVDSQAAFTTSVHVGVKREQAGPPEASHQSGGARGARLKTTINRLRVMVVWRRA